MTKDLTQGRPLRLILGFAVPLLFGSLFQQFYNVIDTLIVGRYLGVDALAAVGSTGSVHFLIIGFCMGICFGFAIPVAQFFGANDWENLRKCVANCIWAGVFFSVILTVLTSIFCRNILLLMDTPANIIDNAYTYIFIIFLGIPTVFLYNITSGIIRSLGDSRTPVIVLMISSLANVVLDLVFILCFHMGVAGAAFATVIAQGLSGILCLLVLMKKFPLLKFRKDEWRPDFPMLMRLCSMGLPMGLQYSVTAIGSVILQTAINSLGSMAVAAVTAASKIGGFLVPPYDALGSTMATWGGQHVGAQKFRRLKEGLYTCIRIGALYSVFAFLVVFFFGNQLGRLFIDTADASQATALVGNIRTYLCIVAAFYFLLSLVNSIRFLIQGMGFPTFAVLAGVLEMVARSLVGIFLIPRFGFIAAALGSPVAWLFADAFLIPAFFHVYKKLQKPDRA